MTSHSEILDKIRIKPKGAKRREALQRAANECAWQNCHQPATHKAPMGRDKQGHYLHFCLEHVRLYNKNFNYFSGLSDEQIAQFQKDNVAGTRPTWKISARKSGEKVDLSSLRARPVWFDKIRPRYDVHGARNIRRGNINKNFTRQLRPLEIKALQNLNLDAEAESSEITAQYKILVKQNHPDSNGGDRTCEARLAEILLAYKTLKKAGLC